MQRIGCGINIDYNFLGQKPWIFSTQKLSFLSIRFPEFFCKIVLILLVYFLELTNNRKVAVVDEIK